MTDFPFIISDDYGDTATVDVSLGSVTLETDGEPLYFSPGDGEQLAQAVMDACQEAAA